MRASSARGAALAVALGVVALAACSTRTLVVVDPYPCPDGGGAACATGLLDGLVGYWRLADPPGSATARDQSGWGNDGALVGLDPTTAWVSGGPEGGALSVQGQGYLNVADSPSIDSITDQVTVAAWMYLDGTITDYATAISRQIGTGYGQHYHLSVTAQQTPGLFITTTIGGQPDQLDIVGATTVPQQTWVHLAGTYDGAEARLYVDGVQVVSGALSGPFAAETNPVVLAGNGNTASKTVSELVPGELDEILLYRRALGADEIARLAAGALLPAGRLRDGGSPGN
ncbi:MAG TPA: LamG domain-containing protein [Polyangia bacterium]|nr:LamG domain-containing protein [Polyangia bacterium]